VRVAAFLIREEFAVRDLMPDRFAILRKFAVMLGCELRGALCGGR